jgi:hypothetical protein
VQINSVIPDTYPYKKSCSANQTVTLTAIPNTGYRFSGRFGDSDAVNEIISVAMTCTKQFTANFMPKTFIISTTASPTNGGEIVLKPLQPEEGYPFGTNVTVTVKPSSGYTFKKWTENPGVTSNPFVLIITKDKSITAVFVEKQPSFLSWIIGGGIAGIIVIGLLVYISISNKKQTQST